MRCRRAHVLTQAFVAGLTLALVLLIGAQAWAQGRQTGTLRGAAHEGELILVEN